MLLGTVKGDLHDIGKNLVAMMCEGSGFEVIDIGFNADPEKFVEGVKKHQPQVVGMSAMLTTTMRAMGYTIKALEEAGLRDTVKIMVGGAPVDADFAKRIGADGYGSNAPAGADLAKKFAAAALIGAFVRARTPADRMRAVAEARPSNQVRVATYARPPLKRRSQQVQAG